MKLHSPQFQKNLQRGVKRAVRASPELKKEYRQARKGRPGAVPPGPVFRAAMSIGLGVVVYNVTHTTGHVATGLAVITLWTFAGIFFQACGLWRVLYRNTDLAALRLIPMPAETMFAWLFQKFLRKSIMPLLDLSAGFVVLAAYLDFSRGQWLALPLVVAAAWLLEMALALLCCARLPPKINHQAMTGMILLAVASFCGMKFLGPVLQALLDRIAPGLNAVLPTGWAVSLFQLLLPAWSQGLPYLVIPTGLLIWTLKQSRDKLRADFLFVEESFWMEPEVPRTIENKRVAAIGPSTQSVPEEGPTAIEEIVESREFLELPGQPRSGLLEKLFWRWLSPREKALSEFAFPRGHSITAPWLNILRNLAIGTAIAFAAGMLSPVFRMWILFITLFVTGCQMLGVVMRSGAAFRAIICSGVAVPIYATFGIGYRELSRVLVKFSILQLPLLVPYITACCMLIAWLCGFSPLEAVVPGIKAGLLIFATRYIFLMFSFSNGTNDSTRFKLRTILLFGLIAGLGLVFMGLAGAGVFVWYGNVRDGLIGWGLCLAAVLDAWLIFQVYGLFYNSRLFDLMKIPK